MYVGIFKDEETLAKAAAEYLMKKLNASERKVVGVATGSTPLPLYQELRDAHAAGTFSLEGFKAFALDEYIGIDPEHPERYRNVLRAELVGDERTGLREEDLNTPDGSAEDPYAAAQAYDKAIKESGGIVVQILGIGSDGHIGFNEPGGALTSRTHVEALTAQTREDNARFFDDDLSKVPTRCITQGLGTIMECGVPLLIATGAGKADAVRELVEGGVSARWPATILQMHQEAVVFLDEAAAAKLELKDFYMERWESLR
ncbi:glucosamine-6-phosphate deaminase [Arcanobacterium phocae]|uniref:glucosamine-6-phosphate deaminase n=1 Tax=Arcanobacterium phocae TaxID=131112 RepID=UPI001C0EC5C3|nr:glucosamine-6-phosphate deaminase [Arcanobacterium phocae]